ncbi:hypothetical protein MLD38_033362 [Melastoma candidum]|nr:hypothetical protein MLD38_033362 [Melastoma candidum]
MGPAQPPAASAAAATMRIPADDRYWSSIDDDTVRAVSFGLVATAVLVSMFLVMAIFERLFRRDGNGRSSAPGPGSWDAETRPRFTDHPKTWQASPKIMSPYGMTVLMPGEDVPTFIAQPAPATAALMSSRQLEIGEQIVRGDRSEVIIATMP